MPRPGPTILLSHQAPDSDLVEEVAASKGVWAVLHHGKAIAIRTNNLGRRGYSRSTFSNSGHAHALARRLNDLYKCSDFSVMRFSVTGPAQDEPLRNGHNKPRIAKISRHRDA